jgi:hypothetical protein
MHRRPKTKGLECRIKYEFSYGTLSADGKKRALEYLKVRDRLVRTATLPMSAATRLPTRYLLEVVSEQAVFEFCQVPLRRRRTSIHYPIGILLGEPHVRSVQKQCPVCRRIYKAEQYPVW